MTHPPKLGALFAYDADVLSDDGRRRLESHLQDCEVCTEALASMQVYEALRADVAEQPIPVPDWARMELPLRREARRSGQSIADQGRIAPAVCLGVAAAALLFVWIAGHTDHEGYAHRRGLIEQAPAPIEAPRDDVLAQLTLLAGSVHVDDTLAETLGMEVGAGASVRVGRRSEAHFRVASGTGFVVGAHTEVAFSELADGRVRLDLAHGTVSSEVAHLSYGDRYEVRAGAYLVRVRGTRFSVTRKVEDVAVRVEEGVVEVVHEGRIHAVIEAPGTWRSGFAIWHSDTVQEPVAISEGADEWPILAIPLEPDAMRVRVGRAEYDVGSLAMRVRPGETEIQVHGPGGALLTQRLVTIGANGAISEGDTLNPDAPEARAGFLAPALIAPPVRAGMRQLEGCHRQEARRGQPPSGVFALRVTIGLSGAVQRAQLIQRRGEPPSPEFQRCVIDEARSWLFPSPTGGTVTFDQPLRFTTRQ
jgi:ferric-dicitrate binding protein FerR (iron transport regulator)